MKVTKYEMFKYEADDGKVFDYKEPQYTEDENGNKIESHLYTTTIFVNSEKDIENYVEVII